MINSYKGRMVEDGQLVKVYFNLRTKLFSIKDVKSGLVLAHGDNIALNNVKFEVNEKGRQRVLSSGRKNVHAYVVGNIALDGVYRFAKAKEVYYNPFKTSKFISCGDTVESCKRAFMSNKKVLMEV